MRKKRSLRRGKNEEGGGERKPSKEGERGLKTCQGKLMAGHAPRAKGDAPRSSVTVHRWSLPGFILEPAILRHGAFALLRNAICRLVVAVCGSL